MLYTYREIMQQKTISVVIVTWTWTILNFVKLVTFWSWCHYLEQFSSQLCKSIYIEGTTHRVARGLKSQVEKYDAD